MYETFVVLVSLVLPAISSLIRKTEISAPITQVGREMKTEMVKELEKCLRIHRKEEKFATATYLDPNFKAAGFSVAEAAAIVENLNEKVKLEDPGEITYVPVC